jgi:hypothetical protein
MIAFLWKLLSDSRIGFFSALNNIFNTLISQQFYNFDLLKNFESKETKQKLLLSLLFIWFISSTILSKSYSSLLLNVYFKPKSQQVVKTVEDIIANENLNLLGSVSLLLLQAIKPNEYEILSKRAINYENEVKQQIIKNKWTYYEARLLKDIINGKTVFFGNTYDSFKILSQYPDSGLIAAEDKYAPNFVTNYMSKNHSYHQIISFS